MSDLARQRRLFLELAKSEAWNTLVMPLFRRKIGELDTAVLTDAKLVGKDLDDTRAKRFVLAEVFHSLSTAAHAAFNENDKDEAAALIAPVSALKDAVLPALDLKTGGTSPPAPMPAIAKLQFPAAPTFNPFGDNPTTNDSPPANPPSTTAATQ
jgi:hypothetical protein